MLFRDDLRVPVLCVEAETDLLTLGYLAARQDDGERLAVWEMAGTAHADVYTFVAGMIDTGTCRSTSSPPRGSRYASSSVCRSSCR